MSFASPDTDFDRAGTSAESPVPLWGSDLPHDREHVTLEPEPSGDHHDPRYPDNDWVGAGNMGGGAVPADLEWKSNPRHDRLPEVIGN